jgi:hypothetical protein
LVTVLQVSRQLPSTQAHLGPAHVPSLVSIAHSATMLFKPVKGAQALPATQPGTFSQVSARN